MDEVVVIKRNIEGQETWRYTGYVVQEKTDAVLLEAYFNTSDLALHGIVIRENDHFIEAYFTNRWYNIFEIHDRDNDHLKAWYCNVTYPSVFGDGEISYIDLALDLLVLPDGSRKVLDEDEFAELPIPDETRQKAREALAELQEIFAVPQDFDIWQLLS